jgi:hypothetical protein
MKRIYYVYLTALASLAVTHKAVCEQASATLKALTAEIAPVQNNLRKALKSYLEDATRLGSSTNQRDREALQESKYEAEQAIRDYQDLVAALIEQLKKEAAENPALFKQLSAHAKRYLHDLIRESEQAAEEDEFGRAIDWGLIGLQKGGTIAAFTTAAASAILAIILGAVTSRAKQEYVASGPRGGLQTAGLILGVGTLASPIIGAITGTLGMIGGLAAGLFAPKPKAAIQTAHEPTKTAIRHVEELLNQLEETERSLQDHVRLQELGAQQKALEAQQEALASKIGLSRKP